MTQTKFSIDQITSKTKELETYIMNLHNEIDALSQSKKSEIQQKLNEITLVKSIAAKLQDDNDFTKESLE